MVATLAPFGHSGFRRATVTQMRGLEVATLAPFGRFYSWRATLTQMRGLDVATLAPFGRFYSWRATLTQIRGLEVATLAPFGLYIQTPDRPPLRLLLVNNTIIWAPLKKKNMFFIDVGPHLNKGLI